MSKTAVVWDERYASWHDAGMGHPESPKRMMAIGEVLENSAVGKKVFRIAPRMATREELLLVHDEDYIESVAATAGRRMTQLDPDTGACAHTWDAARLAAGGLIECVRAVAEGSAKNAFAFVRPPGHHAERGMAKGFCIFNNVAIAAEWLKKNSGIEKIAIIDFDVHHCNGTQHAFYDRADVFVVSIHRWPFYPGTGLAEEIGRAAGKGANLNVLMAAGAGDGEYKEAFVEKIIPRVEEFSPQFLLVSAGFDAHELDPLGGMNVTTEGYRFIMRQVRAVAEKCAGGKFVAVLEGGYSLYALKESVEAQLEVMVD